MWNGWPLERVLYLLLAVLFAGVFVQVTLFHSRQNFRHWAMWVPVVATPALALAALGLTFVDSPGLRSLFAGLSVLGVVIGLVGSYFHIEGVGERVGGYSYVNFMVGPPLVLPFTITGLSLLALAALYLS